MSTSNFWKELNNLGKEERHSLLETVPPGLGSAGFYFLGGFYSQHTQPGGVNFTMAFITQVAFALQQV